MSDLIDHDGLCEMYSEACGCAELEKQLAERDALLRSVAEVAHCGGLAGLSESDALTEVRKLTLPFFNTATPTGQRSAVVDEAVPCGCSMVPTSANSSRVIMCPRHLDEMQARWRRLVETPARWGRLDEMRTQWEKL